MTRLWNDPADFADEAAAGFVRANGRLVQAVYGGVCRSTRSTEPEVAVVIGGGSGHYPTFAGLVGPGLAHGAAMGNLFASPSAHQVESVIHASEQGAGVLLSYGNYAGDVLHFDEAQQSARNDGIDCRTVVVTDDIFSAGPEEKSKRRGIAGDLVVFKIAGAAAAAGYKLDDVERVAITANSRTRSMGVAFTGCTLPGASEPLFTVPEGRMAIGLGIHGEAGIDEVDIPSAEGLARLLVTRLLDVVEIPDGVEMRDRRVVPILNGLGSVKSEELFVVFNAVANLLEAEGVTIVDPRVGEFCTSFDMAGASLTLFWPDSELEDLWLAPADTSAFRVGSVSPAGLRASLTIAEDPRAEVPEASEQSRRIAEAIARGLGLVEMVLEEHAHELGRIDAVAGDGDHGIGMSRGARAAARSASALAAGGAGARTTLARAADAWADSAGGASGALWGVILRELSAVFDDAADEPVAARSLVAGIAAATEAVMAHGGARVGDKTMVDAMVPFAETFARETVSGKGLGAAWRLSVEAAENAAGATSGLEPRLGRARAHGRKAIGTPDAGAVSFALVVAAVTTAFGR